MNLDNERTQILFKDLSKKHFHVVSVYYSV